MSRDILLGEAGDPGLGKEVSGTTTTSKSPAPSSLLRSTLSWGHVGQRLREEAESQAVLFLSPGNPHFLAL